MTKDEVLAKVRNHLSESRTIIAALEYGIIVLAKGYKPEIEGEISALKGMMDTLEVQAQEVKDILDQWPES